jgi:hypothetical protein
MARRGKGRVVEDATPRVGRPALPEHVRRRHSFQVRLSDNERAEIEAAADDQPLGTTIRQLALQAARRKMRTRSTP